jgi:hypothetical protein
MGLFEIEDPTRAAKQAVNQAGEVVQPIVGAVPLLPHNWPEPQPQHRLTINFGGQINLTGYDGPSAGAVVKAGDPVPITLYWESLTDPGQNLTLFIHLVDPATQTQLAGFDGPPDFPTTFWQPGYRITDPRQLSFPAGLPPGTYELQLGWYNPTTLARLPLTGENINPAYLTLLTVNITP